MTVFIAARYDIKVKATNFFGIGSILKGKKKVLWISARETLDYPLSSDLLGQVNFRSVHEGIVADVLSSDVLVLSIDPQSQSAFAELSQFVERSESAVKILLLTGFGLSGVVDTQLTELINHSLFDIFYFDGVEPQPFETVLRQAMDLSEQRHSRKDVLGRTESLSRSKIEIEKKVQQTKALVRFVKGLTGVVSVDDIMMLIQNEIKIFQRVKPPILAYAPGPKNLLLVFSQGAQFVKKTIAAVWPQQNKIRLNDKKDSQFLADIFGRPFGKLMTIPLQLRRKTIQDPLQVSAVLFFEHALSSDEVDQFLTFFQERLQPLGIAFDRLLLEQDLTEASLLWERTFDGLQEPVVIFDSEGQILRANKSFTENLSDVPHADLHLESLRHDDHFYEVHSYPIISGAHAHPTSIINHYVDVTISHRLQKQMIQNEKMAAIGHLAGHIAHELNNPLTGVRSLAQILVEQVPDGSTLKQDLKEVETAAGRCQEIIKNLLDFSSGGFESQQVKVSLAEIVQRTLPLLKTLISRFDTNIDLSAQPDTVFVQPQLLQQVVFNIVKNAAQAMGDAGVLRVQTSFDPVRKEVSLSIADSGGGIPPEIQKQIFDFFFTTKSAGQGTGLGLSMSQSIVERFNGRIELKSEVGKGSEFIIVLPYAGVRP